MKIKATKDFRGPYFVGAIYEVTEEWADLLTRQGVAEVVPDETPELRIFEGPPVRKGAPVGRA